MLIALLAIIGALIDAGAGYWIVFGFWCFFQLVSVILNAYKKGKERRK